VNPDTSQLSYPQLNAITANLAKPAKAAMYTKCAFWNGQIPRGDRILKKPIRRCKVLFNLHD